MPLSTDTLELRRQSGDFRVLSLCLLDVIHVWSFPVNPMYSAERVRTFLPRGPPSTRAKRNREKIKIFSHLTPLPDMGRLVLGSLHRPVGRVHCVTVCCRRLLWLIVCGTETHGLGEWMYRFGAWLALRSTFLFSRVSSPITPLYRAHAAQYSA